MNFIMVIYWQLLTAHLLNFMLITLSPHELFSFYNLEYAHIQISLFNIVVSKIYSHSIHGMVTLI